MNLIHFNVKLVPAGTGLGVWDDPHANRIVERFMPRTRQPEPTIGILHLGAVRPTSNVLRDVIVTVGQDVRAGRYGNFTFIVSSQDEGTRNVVSDIASSQDLPLFVSATPIKLDQAEPVGTITANDRETLRIVLRAGGTVTAAELSEQLGIEQTTAGNRLVALHKKGYLQRVQRPHPSGDQFVDARSVRFGATK